MALGPLPKNRMEEEDCEEEGDVEWSTVCAVWSVVGVECWRVWEVCTNPSPIMKQKPTRRNVGSNVLPMVVEVLTVLDEDCLWR